jgi:hypothetical protein
MEPQQIDAVTAVDAMRLPTQTRRIGQWHLSMDMPMQVTMGVAASMRTCFSITA